MSIVLYLANLICMFLTFVIGIIVLIRITYDFVNHPVRYIYVHNSGSWHRDTKEIDAATRFYEKEVAEEYFDKIRKNPHYEFYYPEILEFDDNEFGPKLKGLEVFLKKVK